MANGKTGVWDVAFVRGSARHTFIVHAWGCGNAQTAGWAALRAARGSDVEGFKLGSVYHLYDRQAVEKSDKATPAARMLDFAIEHGCQACYGAVIGTIEVALEWTRRQADGTTESGRDWVTVSSWGELRRALGY